MRKKTCRFCGTLLQNSFTDLGMSPLANSYVTPENLNMRENFYPLHTYVCGSCFLVQLEEFETPESIFGDYTYFSSYSETWLKHARDYTEMAVAHFGLDETSRVVEIASNDGYLLQYFKEAGIPVLGIEPAANVAEAAKEKGIPTLVEFFGRESAQKLVLQNNMADLLLGNNVLAHVPDIHDFVGGMKILLKQQGVITMEFPHLLRLMQGNQFDTIYHEHFSYFSFGTVQRIFTEHDLHIFDVEELPTHGGSLRIFAGHSTDTSKQMTPRVQELLNLEENAGLRQLGTYQSFSEQVKETKRNILDFLIEAKRQGKTIAGYGAPAKGNTLLNYCGVGKDFIGYTVDRNPYKQGLYLPGTHIPIEQVEKIYETRPDYVIILPWNLKDEIMKQLADIREWGGKFVMFIPKVKVV